MKTPIVPANKLKKTDKKLALKADAIRRLGADPSQGPGNAYVTLQASCTGGTLHICC